MDGQAERHSHDQPVKILAAAPLDELIQPGLLLAVLADKGLIGRKHDALGVALA